MDKVMLKEGGCTEFICDTGKGGKIPGPFFIRRGRGYIIVKMDTGCGGGRGKDLQDE